MTKPGPLMVLSQALSTDLITYTQTVSCLNFRHFDFEKQIKDRISRPLRKFCYSADTRRRSFRLVYFFHNFGVDLYFCEHNNNHVRLITTVKPQMYIRIEQYVGLAI